MRLTGWMVVALAAIVVLPLAVLIFFGRVPAATLGMVLPTLIAWLAPSPVQQHPTYEATSTTNVVAVDATTKGGV